MKKVSIQLENCYGIKSLTHTFDFSKGNVFALYAPNGSMKSSLARTFADVAEGVVTTDRMFPSRVSKRSILDEDGQPILGDQILVVRPYDEQFGRDKDRSTLLVDPKLREEYEELHSNINRAKAALLAKLRALAKTKKNPETEVSLTFTKEPDQFFLALGRVKAEIEAQSDAPYASLPYDTIFDDKVLSFLSSPDVAPALAGYAERYNELIAKSPYFSKDTFNYHNASTIAKSLGSNGFFKAQHLLRLNADESVEIRNEKELEDLIKKERDGFAADPQLRKRYDEIEKLITRNDSVRDFQMLILENASLLPLLGNMALLREELWKSYLKMASDQYKAALEAHLSVAKRKAEIEQQARDQRTAWQSVVSTFNSRFSVPFKLEAKNKVSVILGQEPLLSLSFAFVEGDEEAVVEQARLLTALSTGERKALYVLNVIFEVQTRMRENKPTVVIVDDIADSFDYKNKYAIIQYLQDIAEEENFRLLILTHNFDFFRTVESRFVPYLNCLMTVKRATGVVLERASGIRNIFVNDWQENYWKESRKRVACIPFMRNLIQYTRGETDLGYAKLTALLHWQPISDGIKESELDEVYCSLFGGAPKARKKDGSVLSLVLAEADACLQDPEGINLANKVVLSIGIRLAAEKHMVTKMADADVTKTLQSNQTARLLKLYRQRFGAGPAADVLARVALMTPENIHLNSFMYEPILDMSDEHLRRLYADVKGL